MGSITHKFVSTIPNASASTKVRPSNWNDTHNFNLNLEDLTERSYNSLTDKPSGLLGPGTVTGDIIRFNTVTSAWEVASEPFAFKGLVLTPALTSLVDIEGAIYYNSVQKAVMVCTST